MHILQVNKFYHIQGGADRYFMNLIELLKNKGHQVAVFSMQHEKNLVSNWRKYFVSRVEAKDRSLLAKLRFFGRMMYSFEAKRKISKLLDNFKPDIVHVHNIYHQISPSILIEIKKRNIPVVMTVHDYHLISPNYYMFHDGDICDVIYPAKYYKAVFHRCVKDSHLKSTLEVLEKYFWQLMGWERNFIDAYIAPSIFMEKKLVEYGLASEKISSLPYFVDISNQTNKSILEEYVLYFGRISEEKGLRFLINVISKLPIIKLSVVGIGKEEFALKQQVSTLGLKNVQFMGFFDKWKLRNIIKLSRFTILPSLWYEVAPISILESFVSGKSVVASNIGGIPEIVKDGYNGFLFEPGNIEDCREKILKLWDNPRLCREMGKNAREYVKKNFSPEDHYEKLMAIYKKAITLHK